MTTTPLGAEICRQIEAQGPITVADYMVLCLNHPQFGYYVHRDPIGRAGDFVTSPEISQMFGELIGLWVAHVWQLMGAPASVRLIELGPGHGTLMRDALRAMKTVPHLKAALSVDLIEVSPVLRERQRAALFSTGAAVEWHDTVASVPDGPAIVVANEFFDALPVRQAVRQADGWHERLVTIDSGDLAFGMATDALADDPPGVPIGAPSGAIFEWRDAASASGLGERVVQNQGAALVVDYGHAKTSVGETLQAVRGHAFADPLESPGRTDLTAHVDFDAFGRAVISTGAKAFGPVGQGTFLRRLGINERAAVLRKGAMPHQVRDIDTAVLRLTEPGKRGMGDLFKVMAFGHPELGELPGFRD